MIEALEEELLRIREKRNAFGPIHPFTARKLTAADAAINQMIHSGGGGAGTFNRLNEIQNTKECPRIAAPDKPCTLCGAIDEHQHIDKPRQCKLR